MITLLSNPRLRRVLHARRTLSALAPCLLALGCSLEVAGNGPGTQPLEAGVDGVEVMGGGQGAAPDAQPPTEGPDAAPRETDASSAPEPGMDAGREPDARVETDAGTPPVDASVPGKRDAAPPSAACELEGRYALRFSFDVSWVGTEFLSIVPVIEAGQGELSFVVLMHLKPGASGFDSTFRTCASDVPGFVAALSRERFQARIENEVWDRDGMPVFSAGLETACLEPGCAVQGRPLHALVGAALPSFDAPWPKQPSGGEWPDHDSDGADGIATRMLGPEDGSYAYPPLDLLSTRRLRELALGLRVVVGFDGKLDSCDQLSGRTTPGSSIETRAVGCTANSAPTACETLELEFLNNNLPVWTAHEGRFEAKRLPDSADCAAARRVFSRPRP